MNRISIQNWWICTTSAGAYHAVEAEKLTQVLIQDLYGFSYLCISLKNKNGNMTGANIAFFSANCCDLNKHKKEDKQGGEDECK